MNGSRCRTVGIVPAAHCASATRRETIAVVRDTSMPNLASQMRIAFASMASNTGSSSPGELEMTFSTSRGRGLLLQRLGQIVGALAQLVEQPRVLDGDDGLGGEIRTSSICLSVNGRTSWR